MPIGSSDAKAAQPRIATVSTLDLARKERGQSIRSRLSNEQLSFLRALANGFSKTDAMNRYFHGLSGKERQDQALSTISVARALARRNGDSSAHLIGVDVWAETKTKNTNNAGGLASRYDRDAFLAYLKRVNPSLALSLEEFDDADIYDKYRELFPQTVPLSATSEAHEKKKENRKTRLVARYVDAIKRLEKIAAADPSPFDDVKEWLPDRWTPILEAANIATLDDLGEIVRLGGRWYQAIPGLKPGIAAKLQRYLDRLLPGRYQTAVPVTMEDVLALTKSTQMAEHAAHPDTQLLVVEDRNQPIEARSSAGGVSESTLEATNDVDAVAEWVMSVANSETTMKSYTKEGKRFLAWLAVERGGKQLADLTNRDCIAYLTFLQNIPKVYISRRRIKGNEAGGLIFRGQLTDASVAQARTIVSSMCQWLFAAGYMTKNPWQGLHKKIARTRVTSARHSKALSEDWMKKALDYLAASPPSPSRDRMIFLLEFTTRTGMRPAEIVNAKMGDIQRTDEGLFLKVVGKGNRERWCVINSGAEGALRQHLRERGLPPIESCKAATPLVSSTLNNMRPVGYQSLHESFTAWMRHLIDVLGEPPLPNGQATLHKLRHTFATTAVKDGVPYDVIQAQLGHQNINTTISTYATAPDARRAAEINRMK